MTISEATATSPVKVTLTLSNGELTNELPKEYDLHFMKSQKNHYMFTATVDDEALSIAGKIEHECQIKPRMNKEYKALMERLNYETRQPKRSMVLLEQEPSGVKVGTAAHVKESKLLNIKKSKYSSDNKRDRMPKPELMDILFKAFEQHAFWSIDDLVKKTQQPVAYLKQVLPEICDYIRIGEYRNCYQLKSQFTS